MQAHVLGCSGGISKGAKTTSILIDNHILIDCGTGVGDLTVEEMQAIRHVFITHSHLDHIAALPLMIDTLYSTLQSEPLIVHCHPDTYQAIKEHIFNWDIWPDFFTLPSADKPVVVFEPMLPGDVYQLDTYKIEMIEVNHIVTGVAYRIANGGGALAFSGDTTTNDTFWHALNKHDKLDVLIVECAFGDWQRNLSDLAKHYCPSLLSEDLQKLRHRPKVYISHLMPGFEDRIFNELRDRMSSFDLHRLTSGDLVQV